MRALLLSGGLDSAALAWWCRPDVAVTVDYGQRPAEGEIAAAAAIAGELGIRHEVIRASLGVRRSGILAGAEPLAAAKAPEFWPYRNQLLVTLAAMHLVGEGLKELLIGAVATDVHADGRAPFLNRIDRLMGLQEGGVRVTAPARKLRPEALLARSGFPPELLGVTFSCHVAEWACGQCRGCEKHRLVTTRFVAERAAAGTPTRSASAAPIARPSRGRSPEVG